MSEIVMIEGKHLHAHPDNPRKNLGDLSELAQSIKKNGILQNLTVVPDKAAGEYRVIIGHRRLAAGLIVNLEKFPCVISDMDEHQQFATMLEENMQRSDLTIPEQAYGFQMMFDWGNSVKTIAEKTGFSEQTVKHRLEMAKLGKSTLKAAVENPDWQITIKDLQELEKIKNIKRREEALKGCQSRQQFQNAVRRAVESEIEEDNMNKLEPFFKARGIKEAPADVYSWTSGYEKKLSIDMQERNACKKFDPEKLPKKGELFYKLHYGTLVILKKEEKKNNKDPEMSQEEIARKERARKNEVIKKLFKDMISEIDAFVHVTYEETDSINYGRADALFNYLSRSKEYITFAQALMFYSEDKNRRYYNLSNEEFNGALAQYEKKPLDIRLLVLINEGVVENISATIRYDGTYDKYNSEKLVSVYNLLNDQFGFTWSNPEWQQVMDGTHELYEAGDEDEE